MKNDVLRLAHISDLHFSKLSLNPMQFFSKRWLGTVNLLLKRGRIYRNPIPFSFLKQLSQHQITDVLITGDFTTTSFRKEFQIAQDFVSKIRKEISSIYLIPGNHDHYTVSAYKKKSFYKYFPESSDSPLAHYSLKEHGVAAHRLNDYWWLILMDTAIATPLPYSTGEFSEEIEKNLEDLLREIPSSDHILFANHFPFFQNESPRRKMHRGKHLENILRQHSNIKLYIHGHTHRKCLADLRGNNLPIILDSGTLSDFRTSSWSLLELTKDSVEINHYRLQDTSWKKTQTDTFIL